MAGVLIRGGTVVDGTGGPQYRADVRIADGRITEVGPDLRPDGDKELDASGAFVTPGFIENHTHFDATIFWDPTLDPMPQHGVTSVVMGNCSLSLVPLRAQDRAEMVSVFSFIEDIPEEAFNLSVPWGWESFPEYAQVVKARQFSLNVAQQVGHSPLRMFVMGDEAWDRAATPEECREIARVLDESLKAGAVGVSTSFFDADAEGRPVPSRLADDDEFRAIIEVLAAHRRPLEFIADASGEDPMADVEHIGRLVKGTEVFSSFNGVLNAQPARAVANLDRCYQLQSEGALVYGQVSPRPLDIRINWDTSFTMMVLHDTWGRVIKARGDDKRKLLSDPAWRSQARYDWETRLVPHHVLRRTDRMRFVEVTRPENERWIGSTMADMIREKPGHVSDLLADWVLENDLGPGVVIEGIAGDDPNEVAKQLTHPGAILGNSDAGAHVQMLCSLGDSTLLLTRHTRDRQDLTIERAIHLMTGKQAEDCNFPGRGVISAGNIADITVFDLGELHFSPHYFVEDLPGGSRRYRRPPGGYRYTLVSGELSQASDQLTDSRPGRFLAAG